MLLMGQAGRSRPVERTLAKVKARQQPFACTPWHLGVSVRAFALLNLLKPQTATFHIFIQSSIVAKSVCGRVCFLGWCDRSEVRGETLAELLPNVLVCEMPTLP